MLWSVNAVTKCGIKIPAGQMCLPSKSADWDLWPAGGIHLEREFSPMPFDNFALPLRVPYVIAYCA